MKRLAKIDTTHKERRDIVLLLQRVEAEGVTGDEMEEIGYALRASGLRALPPLLRRLWREKRGNVISRYAFLLDFFEDESWLDELVEMAVRRRDLGPEAQAAFLAALEGCGVDVDSPAFASLRGEADGPLVDRLPALLDRGDEGLIVFVTELLCGCAATRSTIIRALPDVADPRVVALLELLLGIADHHLQRECVAALGRIRSGASARLLAALGREERPWLGATVSSNLRRLAFLGIHPDAAPPPPPFLPFRAAGVSPVDGAGYRVLRFVRPTPDGTFAAIYLQLHEDGGVDAVWGRSRLEADECDNRLEALDCEDGTVPVPPAYAVRLLRDALHRSRVREGLLPAAFYVWRRYLAPEELIPLSHTPTTAHGAGQTREAGWLGTEALLDDDYFAGWLVASDRVYDLAEEWLSLDEQHDGPRLAHGVELLVTRFCREILEPDRERLHRRLLLVAELMEQAGRERSLVEQTLGVAESLAKPRRSGVHHPFLRRLARESLELAREALEEGYDLRRECGDADDDGD
jgi:hypothetical protein